MASSRNHSIRIAARNYKSHEIKRVVWGRAVSVFIRLQLVLLPVRAEAVLDAQLLLAVEWALPTEIKQRIATMDGTEITSFAPKAVREPVSLPARSPA